MKRIRADLRELQVDPSDQYFALPLEENIFEWHFVILGQAGTDFEGGIYHGRIMLPSEYPFKPPNFMLLTPNGRFELRKKICLSISGYHPEHWQPAWGIRLILEALISFFPTPGEGAVGSCDYPKAEREKLARQSIEWTKKDQTWGNEEVWEWSRAVANRSMEERRKAGKNLKYNDTVANMKLQGATQKAEHGSSSSTAPTSSGAVQPSSNQPTKDNYVAETSSESGNLVEKQRMHQPEVRPEEEAGAKIGEPDTTTITNAPANNAVPQSSRKSELDSALRGLCFLVGLAIFVLVVRKFLRSKEQGGEL